MIARNRALGGVLQRGVDAIKGGEAVEGSLVRVFARALGAKAPVSATVHQPIQTKRPGKLDGDVGHTAKWLDSTAKPSPMEYSAAAEPIGVAGDNVSCDSPGACKDRFGVGEGGLGAPNTYYKLNDTSKEFPAKCKYCGLRFYTLGGGH